MPESPPIDQMEKEVLPLARAAEAVVSDPKGVVL
jgi:hypothetical protein